MVSKTCAWSAMLLLCLMVAAMTAIAQERFQVLTQNAISEVQGLRIVTIRDNQLAACYTVFIMEPVAAPESVAPVTTTTNDATEQSIQRIRAAAEKHDRQLAELKGRRETELGTGLARSTATTSGAFNPSALNKYEAERKQIDDEFERVLRAEMPGSYPWAVSTPGMRTGGWEDAAEAMRRGITNPDPKALAEPVGLNRQLEFWFKRMIEAPRLAASGPVPCAAPDPTKAPR